MAQVIVVGGGLSGLSTAHTVLERGGRVLVIDKNAFMGGNSTKATSGINGTPTRTQAEHGYADNVRIFEEDTALSASGGKSKEPSPLAKVLCGESGPAVEWLIEKFGLDMSCLGQLGGHSFPRTHRGKERFPGMTITYALMEKLEEIAEKEPERARIITKARVTKLLKGANGAITGVSYEKDGQTFEESAGAVVIATGGYGADFSQDSILRSWRPDICHLPTTNGDHCTGDGIKMSEEIGGGTTDMKWVQVHPTGLVNPAEPDAKVKFLAAEALRGVGGLLLDANGNRFCDEMGRRDYVTGEMNKNKGPFRLVLNSACASKIAWHCKHYVGRGLMKEFDGNGLAADMGIPVSNLKKTFDKYNEIAKTKKDPYGKKFFHSVPFTVEDNYHVGFVTPVIHYCMGGLWIDTDANVLDKGGKPIPGLYATGEVCGGIHGINRLGGSSLLDCVVFGRVSGSTCTRYILDRIMSGSMNPLGANASNRASMVAGHLAPTVTVSVTPGQSSVNMNISWGANANASQPPAVCAAAPAPKPAAAPAPAPVAPVEMKEYTWEQVAAHNKEDDCWVVVNGEVLDVTKFLPDHPGGKKAILLFAGKDATEEFNMLHKPEVIPKYAPDAVIGTIAGGNKALKAKL